jgi:hypothetical protein
MAIPNMPVKAWLQIAVILGLLFVALAASRHLWSTGGRALAGAPLLLYTGLIALYAADKRVKRKG